MPIIRSTKRDDKPHTVFCNGREAVDLRRGGGSRVHLLAKCTRDPPHLLKSTTARPVHNTVCGFKCTRDPHHLLKSTTARPVQNTVCGLSSHLVLLVVGMTSPNELSSAHGIHLISSSPLLHDQCTTPYEVSSAHGIHLISSSPLLHDECRTPYAVCRPLLYS
jgi:hypothetical protein